MFLKRFLSLVSGARFSDSFLKRARFPSRPELLSDVPQEQQTEFVPGRDKLFEKIIEGEREDSDESDALSVVEAGHDTESESEKEEDPPTPVLIMPPKRMKFQALAPNKQSGQCEVSWEALNPVVAFVDVEDPTMKRRKASQTRKGITVRVDIPCGLVLSSFLPEVSADGTTLLFSAEMEQSRCDPSYTLGSHLFRSGRGIPLAMTKALQEYWTNVIQKCKGNADSGAEPKEYKEYSLRLPEPCEREFRDPCNRWEVNDVNSAGSTVKIDSIRSCFYYLSLFTVASKNFTPAMASRKKLLHMEEITYDNPMNSANLAETNFLDRCRIDGLGGSPVKKTPGRHRGRSRRHRSERKHRSKSRHHRSRSPDISNSLHKMSISAYDDDDDDSTISSPPRHLPSKSKGSTRRRVSKDHHSSHHYNETESQYRNRQKGKQRRLLEHFNRKMDDELDGLTMEELKARSRELDKAQEDEEEFRAEEERQRLAEELRLEMEQHERDKAERRRTELEREEVQKRRSEHTDDRRLSDEGLPRTVNVVNEDDRSRSGRSEQGSTHTRRTRRSRRSRLSVEHS